RKTPPAGAGGVRSVSTTGWRLEGAVAVKESLLAGFEHIAFPGEELVGSSLPGPVALIPLSGQQGLLTVWQSQFGLALVGIEQHKGAAGLIRFEGLQSHRLLKQAHALVGQR